MDRRFLGGLALLFIFALGCDGAKADSAQLGAQPDATTQARPDATAQAQPDAGGPCAACDPPRDGQFCGYTAGCGVNQPQRACHHDGSGDAAMVYFCSCDGVTQAAPSRWGGWSDWAANVPFLHHGLCASSDGGTDAGIQDVEGVIFDSGM